MKKEIKNEKLDFYDFYKRLCSMLDENGQLSGVVIEGNTIYNVPSRYRIVILRDEKKFLGITLCQDEVTFCGFVSNIIRIQNNNFMTEGATIN